MNTTVRVKPGETVKAFHELKAQPFVQYRQQPPGAPIASGTAGVTGLLTLDLPTRTPISLVRADGTAIQINNATTVVTSP